MWTDKIGRTAIGLALALALPACGGDDDVGDRVPGGTAGSHHGEGHAGGGGSSGASAGRGGASGNTGTAGSAGAGAGGEGGAGGSSGSSGGGAGAGDGDGDGGTAGSSGSDALGECDPTPLEHAHDSMPPMHVPSPLPASEYNSSPPSSGPHCSMWGSYGVYGEDAPLPPCNFLHNLEHGAIVLLYNCPDGCADVVAALEQLIADAPDDPDCGAAKRLVLTPYTEMTTAIAAAAWGYTWTADCLDAPARSSLLEFIAAHQGSSGDAPEPLVCAGGAITP